VRQWIALALNLVGLIMAMIGVTGLAVELGQAHPAKVLLDLAVTLCRRLVGRQQPVVGEAHVIVGTAATATGRVFPPTVTNERSTEERIASLESALTKVHEDMDAQLHASSLRFTEVERLVATEQAAREAGDSALDRTMIDRLAGPGGRGLALTWAGLAITLLGTIVGGLPT